jgi:hypothetical protein
MNQPDLDAGEIRMSVFDACRLRQVFVATCLAAVALGWQTASALPTGFGSGCTVNGGTGAATGSGDAPGANSEAISGTCTSKESTSNGRVDVAVQTDGGPNLFSFAQAATTSVGAQAGLGTLHAFSSSSATSDPGAYLYTVNGAGAITENEYGAAANSTATAQWYDLLTVGGAANANGFVVLRFTLDLHGQTFASPPEVASARIESRLFINDGARYNDQIIDLSEPGTTSVTIGFRQGQQVQLYGDLNVTSTAFAGRQRTTVCNGWICQSVRGDYFRDSSAVADAANTAGFHIDVVTEGGAYSTLSGQYYASIAAVPEPSTWAFLASGLLALAGVRQRRSRR